MKRKYYKKYELPNPPVALEQPVVKKMPKMNPDDIIIPILILLMMTEEKPDYITIAALVFIFFA